MTAFIGILKRELLVAFTTPLAYVALGAFALMSAVAFWLGLSGYEVAQQRALATHDPTVVALLDFNDVLLGSVLIQAQVLLLFVVPLVTMRTFAGDERSGTLELMYGSPASSSSIVLAKVAGVLVVIGAVCGMLALYPLLLHVLGRAVVQGDGVVDFGKAVLGIVGVFLVGALYAAVGVAASAFTRSTAAAALVTSLLLVALWFVGGAAPTLDGTAATLLGWMAPASHLERLVRGVLTLGDSVYFASTLAGLVLFTIRVVALQRRA